MATKRFVKSSIDWAAFAERVPSAEKIKFQQFKAKVDGYTKNLLSLPVKPPAIDFSVYRSRLPNQAMVNDFEKQYNSVKVPFPADKLSTQIDEQEKQLDVQLKNLTVLSDMACKYYEKQLQWWKDMIPFEEMTMEDYYDYFPDTKDNFVKYPSFWPHEEPFKPVFPYRNRQDHH